MRVYSVPPSASVALITVSAGICLLSVSPYKTVSLYTLFAVVVVVVVVVVYFTFSSSFFFFSEWKGNKHTCKNRLEKGTRITFFFFFFF